MNTDDFRILLAEGKQKEKKFWAIVKDEGNEELRVYYGPISMQDMRILLTHPLTARGRRPHRIKSSGSGLIAKRQFDRKIQEKVDRDYELLFPEHQQYQAIKAILYWSGENIEEEKGVEEEAQDSSAPEPKRSWRPDEEFVWF